jgi:hypothetical protein
MQRLKQLRYGAGRGVEPPKAEARRILSQFFGVLQRVAINRKLSHKLFIINEL